MWLQYLPLRDDDVEAKVVHAQLLRLVQTKNPQLLAAANLPKILPLVAKVIIEVLAQEDLLADETTAKSMAGVLKQLMTTPHVRRLFHAARTLHGPHFLFLFLSSLAVLISTNVSTRRSRRLWCKAFWER